MAIGRDNWRLPRMQPPRVVHGDDMYESTVMEYDEVIFDPETNRYLALSQQQEIYKLRDELKKKDEERSRKLENIIGYYYKNR